MSYEIEIVRIPVQPTRAQALIETIEHARNAYLSKPACQAIEILLGEFRNEVTAIITWTSPEAHARALQSPESVQFLQRVTPFAAGKPDIKKYTSAASLK